ncbi:cupin domain-containing protein [Bacillus tuaregi]|uniref:cupin domain-containing protein n=1 Tax=Bacillus tuaregi TaxID=1816695 RepID=UPI0008F8E115|nr:cupin domain-containing protein [Bacillus tuaregi]
MEKQSIPSYQLFNEGHFSKNIIFKSNHSQVFLLNLLPGQEMPSHYHIGAELYLHVLQGSGTFSIDGHELIVSQNEVIHCDGTQRLGFANTGNENVSIFVTLSKMNR